LIWQEEVKDALNSRKNLVAFSACSVIIFTPTAGRDYNIPPVEARRVRGTDSIDATQSCKRERREPPSAAAEIRLFVRVSTFTTYNKMKGKENFWHCGGMIHASHEITMIYELQLFEI
jgi:hypothetical protein